MDDKFEPRCMKKWQDAPNYMGEDLSDYFIVVSKHRDSGLLQESNFETIKRDFADKEGIEIASFSHWAVGWVESMIVSEDAPEDVLMELDEVICQLQDHYPVYDEADWSQREYDETLENIKFEGKLDDDTARQVYGWLGNYDETEIEGRDDRGGYPSQEAIQRALEAIGMEVE